MASPNSTCSVDGCARPEKARRLCAAHYERSRKYGLVLPDKPIQSRGDLSSRFWKKVCWTPLTGCWEWTGSKKPTGYGSFGINGRAAAAHRIAYELAFGPIAGGLTIDHLCRNRACVNPFHLEPVSLRVNILRGTSPAALNALKTHCPQGHLYDDANTYANYKGRRRCRTCRRIRRRKKPAYAFEAVLRFMLS